MLKIKDFKIISGLEGNATDGWYMYSNVGQYTITIQVDVETDVANAAGVVRIDDFQFGYYSVGPTQQSQSISSTTDGVQIIASYLVDKSYEIEYDNYDYRAGSVPMAITITDSTDTDDMEKEEVYNFVPYSLLSFSCSKIEFDLGDYINNKMIECYTGSNVSIRLHIFFDPASNYSIEDCKYKLYDLLDANESEYQEKSDIILGPITHQEKIRNGYHIVEAIIYNIDNTAYNYITSSSNKLEHIGCLTSALNDFSDYLEMNDDFLLYSILDSQMGYFSLSNIYTKCPLIYFSSNNTISIIGNNHIVSPNDLTSNTDTLHVWGDIIANNITDATSRLTAAQATLTTLNDMFTIETVVTGTYTTKKANTLEDTGITFGNLEQGAIYAIYGSNTNGRVADLRIRAKNGSGTDIDFYEYCLNSNTRMNNALPVFYCRTNKGSTYGDYHLWVSRTATGSNTYTIYKILGPLL